ncbi:MAG: CRISPR-associated endonuclease Cas3'', partial [Thermoanaerobacterium sp.]|nr:CRISPR-associated endonuclease Cas3'' [Thermoanaerobacterium sp.]
MSTSCFSELYSHPDKYLEEHLSGCADLAEKFLDEVKVNLIDEELLSRIIKIVALCHDLGKSTNFFQEYLTSQDDNKKKELKSKKETHHSLMSAVIAYFAVKHEINGLDVDNDTKILLPFISYIVIKKHHG